MRGVHTDATCVLTDAESAERGTYISKAVAQLRALGSQHPEETAHRAWLLKRGLVVGVPLADIYAELGLD